MEALPAELTGWILAKTVTQCKRVAIYSAFELGALKNH
jgi:hypothetical protein